MKPFLPPIGGKPHAPHTGPNEGSHTHPGHQKPVHTSHGGADHSHPHMSFHAPKQKHAGHFKSDPSTGSNKHIVPQGTYGPADPSSPSIAGNQDPAGTMSDPAAPDGYGGDDTSQASTAPSDY
jgi:hypothetical protein